MIDASVAADSCRSRSDFVNKAIKAYAASLAGDLHQEMLGHELINIIRANIKNSENHIASCIFKLAGEQATLNLLIADQLIGDMDAATVRAYRNEAYDIVRKRHGVFNFEDAMENAKEVADSEN